MVLGGNYSIAAGVDEEQERMTVATFIKNLSRSVPLVVYLVSLSLAVCSIKLPRELISALTIASNANPFLAMLMLGILLDLKLNWQEITRLAYLLSLRLAANILIAGVIYFLLPIDKTMKIMLLVCLVSPISVMSPIYALKLGSRSAEPANVNSLSILVSLVMMVLLIFYSFKKPPRVRGLDCILINKEFLWALVTTSIIKGDVEVKDRCKKNIEDSLYS